MPLLKKKKIDELSFTNFIQDAMYIDKTMRGATGMIMDDILHTHLSGEVENS